MYLLYLFKQVVSNPLFKLPLLILLKVKIKK